MIWSERDKTVGKAMKSWGAKLRMTVCAPVFTAGSGRDHLGRADLSACWVQSAPLSSVRSVTYMSTAT